MNDDQPGLAGAALATPLTAVIVVVNVLWLWSGALMTRFFRDPRTNRIVNVSFAVLLLASVVLAVPVGLAVRVTASFIAGN